MRAYGYAAGWGITPCEWYYSLPGGGRMGSSGHAGRLVNYLGRLDEVIQPYGGLIRVVVAYAVGWRITRFCEYPGGGRMGSSGHAAGWGHPALRGDWLIILGAAGWGHLAMRLDEVIRPCGVFIF